MATDRLSGVFAAAVTPLQSDLRPDLHGLVALLSFLAGRGCHGALLLGTTGEGPSFSREERLAILRAAREVLIDHPDFRLLAGTGTPSLEESIQLSRAAFDLGYEAILVLPPYYFRRAPEDGLFAWFDTLMQRGMPADGRLLAYHIPSISGVPLSFSLISRLLEAHPGRFAGLKDSSGDPDHARSLGKRFGTDLFVLNGNDRLFSLAMRSHASGCITALANLWSPDLRALWEAHRADLEETVLIERISTARAVLDSYSPAAPTLKAVLAEAFGFPRWTVKPPLHALPPDLTAQAVQEFTRSGLLDLALPPGLARTQPGG